MATGANDYREYWARQNGFTGDFSQLNSWLSSSGKRASFESALRGQGLDPYGAGAQGTVPSNGTGVVPLNVVPLNQWEKTGLSGLANPGAAGGGGMVDAQAQLRAFQADPTGTAAKYTSPYVAPAMAGASAALAAGQQSLTPDAFKNGVAGFSNPYQQQVVDASLNQVQTDADKTRAKIMAAQGGRRSFGDSSSAIQLSELDNNTNQNLASTGANLRYQGFNDAAGRTVNQFNQDRANNFTAANGYLSQATGGQNIGASASGLATDGISGLFNFGQQQTAQTLQNSQNQVNAGQYVRNYNQDVADQAYNLPRTALSTLSSGLSPFLSGGAQTSYGQVPTMATQLGGAGLAAYGLYQGGAFGNGSALPWQASGNVNPNGGNYR